MDSPDTVTGPSHGGDRRSYLVKSQIRSEHASAGSTGGRLGCGSARWPEPPGGGTAGGRRRDRRAAAPNLMSFRLSRSGGPRRARQVSTFGATSLRRPSALPGSSCLRRGLPVNSKAGNSSPPRLLWPCITRAATRSATAATRNAMPWGCWAWPACCSPNSGTSTGTRRSHKGCRWPAGRASPLSSSSWRELAAGVEAAHELAAGGAGGG
jgi:hypothetical protein